MLVRAIRALLAFSVVVGAGVFLLYRLTKTPPAWYAPPDAEDARVVEVADLVENRVLEEVHKIRNEPQPWTLRVRDEHVNAWLSAKMREWLDHEPDIEWPEALGTPQVRFRTDAVEIAADVDGPDGHRVIVVRLLPRVSDGELRVELDRVTLGRLPVPGSAIERLRDNIPHEALQALEGWLTGERAVPLEMALTDERNVRIVEARWEDGYVELTCETERSE